MVRIHDITWALTGAMIALLLSVGIRAILEIPIWPGEAILYLATLVTWTVFAVLDGRSERREIERAIGILEDSDFSR